jgi:hypothetical protein
MKWHDSWLKIRMNKSRPRYQISNHRPAMLDMLAMDTTQKESIEADLNLFIGRRED